MNLSALPLGLISQVFSVIDGCLLGTCTGSDLIDHLSLDQTILS